MTPPAPQKKKYEVYFTDKVINYHYQIVEAYSKEEAIEEAEMSAEWTTYQFDSLSSSTKTRAKLAEDEG